MIYGIIYKHIMKYMIYMRACIYANEFEYACAHVRHCACGL